MNYTILIHETPDALAMRSDPARRDSLFAPVFRYIEAIREAGIHVAGAGLELPATAKTLRFSDGGGPVVQDGPYADTKEQLAGFFVIDVPDMGTALDWARRFPPLPGRVLELRPNLQPRE
jgi:hypothetical protein